MNKYGLKQTIGLGRTNTPLLPPKGELETLAVLRKLAPAHRYLAELKGMAETIPNQNILIETLSLQEAKDSSEIENIVTTQDEMYRAELFRDIATNPAAKEVGRYATALKDGFEQVAKTGLITTNLMIHLYQILKQNKAGLRNQPGTELKNDSTGETIYVPPQDAGEIQMLMNNLEDFINKDELSDLDPLIKMAIIHHQFETIHPFYDGNGRAGRIINILYLVAKNLLDLPILYLSRYITKNKSEYYRLLQETRDTGQWEPWLLFILDAIEKTARQTILIIRAIRDTMIDYKHRMRSELPKIYSQDLLNNLFRNPYTKIEFVQNDLGVSRLTASKYLNQLTSAGFVEKHKSGTRNYYINRPLLDLLFDIPNLPDTH